MALTELAQRTLGDGSQTVITLFHLNDDALIVEARNVNGSTSMVVSPSEALDAFHHPFSRDEWLSYPGTKLAAQRQALRELAPAEYARLEAIEATDA